MSTIKEIKEQTIRWDPTNLHTGRHVTDEDREAMHLSHPGHTVGVVVHDVGLTSEDLLGGRLTVDGHDAGKLNGRVTHGLHHSS